ncbi:inner membrane protein YhhQ [Pedobacter glucosidilyticus]|uniref:queuosine precursor transporter n=1 Tax=Pedobacter aquae TaxID=2605747 RepID=UPI00057E64F5|nr:MULTISPECIES: queuosine precursor transporter [Pedobacter]KHJ36853.1 inner membrane protein YhhQ [Pedobacter glucosidilyticus]
MDNTISYQSKANKLYIILGGFFIANAILAEFIGVKIFSVEESIGLKKFDIDLFGVEGLSFNMSAGVLNWPFVFIMTDIINEYYGVKGVKFLSYLGAALIAFAFLMVGFAMSLSPADFWLLQNINGEALNMNNAFSAIFGQGMWIIIGSITAFLIGQVADVSIFHKIKKLTGERNLWLRATGSTLVSQLIDSFVVIFIAFYLNPQYSWSWQMVAAIGLVNYTYKFIVALLLTPILYVLHSAIDRYLGKDLAQQLIAKAAQ